MELVEVVREKDTYMDDTVSVAPRPLLKSSAARVPKLLTLLVPKVGSDVFLFLGLSRSRSSGSFLTLPSHL